MNDTNRSHPYPDPDRATPEPRPPAPDDAPAEAPAATEADRPRGPLDDTTRICGSCGGTNEADARFCKFCGTAMKKLDGSAVAPAQTPVAGEIGGAP